MPKKAAAPEQKLLKDLAEELGLSEKELRTKIADLGFDIGPKEKGIEKDLAELVMEELSPAAVDEADTAELYDELVHQEREREIIKSQRKKKAAKMNTGAKTEEKAQAAKAGENVEIGEVISVKEFAEKMGINAARIIGELMKNGILANLNQVIDYETASLIATEFGVTIKRIHEKGTVEDIKSGNIEKLLDDDPENLEVRPPVVSIMGHVDHGKTKLLDYIREADVVSTESGGITQHIGAYQVSKDGKKITFLDTPGHEAFTSMRARGARATDIAILVVAADEGVKPQTIEAINHAKEAGIPIIVAINKIDKENAQPDKVKGELVEHGLQPEDWGGKTIMTPVSAITGEGIDTLLEMILLVAEMETLKANYNRPAVGTVVEAHLDQSLGPVATILINTGTLKVSDNVVVGASYGKIKTMIDHHGKRHKKVDPSAAVRISGLSSSPMAGDILQVMPDDRTARDHAMKIKQLYQNEQWANRGMGMDEIVSQIKAGKLKTLKIILKADTKGSLEAIRQALAKIKDEEVAIKVIHAGVGAITEGDILMASASKGLVVGFHVDYPSRSETMAERENVDVMRYEIIYKLVDDLTNLLAGLIEPEIVDIEVGKLEVKAIFMHGKKDMIFGGKVRDGKAVNKAEIKIFRDEEQVGEGKVIQVRRNKDAVQEVASGQECGIKVTTDIKIEEGDIIHFIKKEKQIRTLSLNT